MFLNKVDGLNYGSVVDKKNVITGFPNPHNITKCYNSHKSCRVKKQQKSLNFIRKSIKMEFHNVFCNKPHR